METALLRLVAQRLAGLREATPVDAVRRLAAAQGQDPPGALLSVALRCGARTLEPVREALARREVVTTWPMRGTMHVVAAEDVGWLLQLGAARVEAASGPRRAELGLGDDDLRRAREVAEEALTGTALPRTALFAAWEAGGVATGGQRGYHLVRHLAHTGVLCLGPPLERGQALVLVEEHLGPLERLPRDEAVDRLVLRYFLGHGPATVADLVRWAGVPAGEVRAGLARVGDRLLRVRDGRRELWLDPAVPDLLAAHRRDAGRVVLLPGFDELVLGYADRTATVPAEHAGRIVPGGNGVFRPTVVHRGVALGTWRAGGGGGVDVDVEPFDPPLPPAVVRGVARAAAALPR
ncbi:winged helix DNA-binding domain-containing protein [Vallicoccus soli]|uniref:Winged helix DNA-binding domain-containing protein n=1 Tax=Vallicoccus soli TaxID=2339232 RepID=A0A3A3YW99_9ACTN|nr:winged helix DNA-binding domain-containing protein [Vallicoccus soli]RJK94957.1 winged helix DNA-binding domain-containing protein [Vallicoccus soli]